MLYTSGKSKLKLGMSLLERWYWQLAAGLSEKMWLEVRILFDMLNENIRSTYGAIEPAKEFKYVKTCSEGPTFSLEA